MPLDNPVEKMWNIDRNVFIKVDPLLVELIFKRSVVASHMPANVEHLLLTPA